MFLHKIDIRWSDLDPNMHLANSAYINFMSATRIEYMIKQGVSYLELKQKQIGPIALRETIHYFKEVFPGKPIYVSQEIAGLAEDGMFYKIRHNFYNSKGVNVARGEMLGSWLDLETRKIITPPTALFEKLLAKNHTTDFKIITKEETRLVTVKPENIDL